MSRYFSFFILAFLLLSPTLGLSHGGAQHVMGTVAESASDHIVIKTTKGKLVTVAINSNTVLQKDGITIQGTLPEVGNRIIAETVKNGDKLLARELHFSAPKTKTK